MKTLWTQLIACLGEMLSGGLERKVNRWLRRVATYRDGQFCCSDCNNDLRGESELRIRTDRTQNDYPDLYRCDLCGGLAFHWYKGPKW